MKLGTLWEIPTEPDVRSVSLMADLVFHATIALHPGLRPIPDVEAQAQLDGIRIAAGHEEATTAIGRPTFLRTHLFKMLSPDVAEVYAEWGKGMHFLGRSFRYALVPARYADGHVTNRFWAVQDDAYGFTKVAILLDDPIEDLLIKLSPYSSFGEFVCILCQLVRMFSDPLALGGCLSSHRDVLTRNLELLLGCLRLAGGVDEREDAGHAADATEDDGGNHEPVHDDSSTCGRPESVLRLTVEVGRRGGIDSCPCACRGGAR